MERIADIYEAIGSWLEQKYRLTPEQELSKVLIICCVSPGIAQLVERSTDTRKVLGSNPSARTQNANYLILY